MVTYRRQSCGKYLILVNGAPFIKNVTKEDAKYFARKQKLVA